MRNQKIILLAVTLLLAGVFLVVPVAANMGFTTISPETGPTTGGTEVTISGTALPSSCSVTIGGAPATITSCSATQIRVTTPVGTVGAKDVVITNTTDSTFETEINVFSYVAAAATQIEPNSVTSQNAAVSTAVATPPSVIVRDASGNPVSGVSVTFTVIGGGGTVSSASATTNSAGIATVGSWTMGPTAGTNTLTATSGTLTGSPVIFIATGTVGTATQIAAFSSTSQSAPVSTAVGTPPCVVVRDASSNPVSGVSVTFAITAGGGSLGTSSVTTNSSGLAQVGSWTLGSAIGTNTLTATSSGLSGSPVTFTATGTTGNGSIYFTSTPSGAVVYVDSVKEGNTPFTLYNVTAGSHTIKIQRASYLDWADRVTVTAGNQTTVTAKMTAIDTSTTVPTTAPVVITTAVVPTKTVKSTAKVPTAYPTSTATPASPVDVLVIVGAVGLGIAAIRK